MEDGQNIKVKIAGKEYPLKVYSEESEQTTRLAMEDVNKRLAVYDAKFPDRPLEDKLAFVCLNESMAKIRFQRQYNALVSSLESLRTATTEYLDGINKE